jgi:ABC-type sugar transport system substrate-binding protein
MLMSAQRRHALIPAIVAGLLATLAVAAPAAAAQRSAAPVRSPLRIAVVLKTLSNPYWVAMKDGVLAEARKLHIIANVQAAAQESSISGQTDILTSLESRHYDAYLVAPITPQNLLPALRSVSKAHIPIINLDSPVDFAQARVLKVSVVTFISSNNNYAGRLAGQYMVKLLKGHGQVGIVEGLPGDPTSHARASGFSAAATAGGLTVVADLPADWDREKALNAATQVLAAHPTVRGFYSANDDMGLGVEKAIQNKRLQAQVVSLSTDGIMPALQAIQAHQYAGTVSQYPYEIGVLGVEAAVATLKGHAHAIPARITSPVELITPMNVAQAIRAFPRPFFPFSDPLTGMM